MDPVGRRDRLTSVSRAPGPPGAWLPSAAETRPVVYAPHIARLLAWFVDVVIIVVLEVVVLLTFGVFIAAQGLADLTVTGFIAGLLTAAVLLVLFGYHPWFWARGGQTPGLRAMGLRVVRDGDGGRVGGYQAAGANGRLRGFHPRPVHRVWRGSCSTSSAAAGMTCWRARSWCAGERRAAASGDAAPGATPGAAPSDAIELPGLVLPPGPPAGLAGHPTGPAAGPQPPLQLGLGVVHARGRRLQ